MTTRNLVPRADNEGKLGISSKKWSEVNATSANLSTLKVSSLKLNAVADLDFLTNGAGIESITTNNDGQFVIAMDDTFLTNLGFNADGSSPGFEANGTVLAGDSIVTAINKLDTAVSGVAAPDDLTVASFDAAAITTSIELFADNDTTLMTSAAIDDRILSYGYTTNVGDITGVTAGTNLSGGGTSGSVTLNVVGSPTFTTVNATTVDLGNWTITESSGVLYFATSGTNKMKLDASGNLTVVGNVTAYGSV